MLKQLTQIGLLAFIFLTTILAQNGSASSAYVDRNGLIIQTNQQQIINGNITDFRHLKWREDGRYLLFYSEHHHINLYDPNADQVTLLQGNSTIFPADFTTDQAVVYSANPQPVAHDVPAVALTVYRHPIGGQAEAIGTIQVLIGCGGTFIFPMDAIYNNETGFGGRPLIFAYSDQGIVYSTSCDGVGVGLLNLATGETEILGDKLTRATLSADRGRLVAFDEQSGALQVIHLADRARQTIPLSDTPDQITWNQDGTAIFYSTRHFISEPLPLSADEEAVLIAKLGLSRHAIPQYHVSVRRVDLNGDDRLLFQEPAWAVGGLNSHANGVYFNLISNGETWVEALANGTVDPFAGDSFMQAWHSVQVSTLLIPEQGGAPALLVDGVYQMALRP
jgi:hypothetical protein